MHIITRLLLPQSFEVINCNFLQKLQDTRNKRNETFARYLSNVLNYTVSGHQLETCTLYEFRPFNSNTQVQAGLTKGCPSAVYKILSETLKELTFDLSILMNFKV